MGETTKCLLREFQFEVFRGCPVQIETSEGCMYEWSH